MRWVNTETPTFAGDDGSGNAPAVAESMVLKDRDNNTVKSYTKTVAGVFTESVDGTTLNALSTVAPAVGDFIPVIDVTAAVAASGYYTIATIPADGETIKFNGVTFTFKTVPVADDDIEIGTLAGSDTAIGVTIDNLITELNAHANALVSAATYTDNHTSTDKNGTRVIVTYDTAGAYGNTYTLGTQSVKSVRTGPVLTGGSDESYAQAKIAAYDGVLQSKLLTFTENATNTIHTGTVALPAGAWLHDIQVTSSVLWTGGTATLKVGDTADDDGYFTGVNLKATDLLVGEMLSAQHGDLWGGKNGAYLVAATGQRGPAATNFACYYPTATNILATVTVGTPATTAGRTFVKVIYSVGNVTAAVSTGP